ncbi:MAG: cytochrome c3 family protein, partial [Blastocatellia bacterium]
AVFLFLVDTIADRPSPYIGIFYMTIPAVLIFGLILVPVGGLFERRKRRKLASSEIPAYPKLDLNNPAHRRAAATFIVVTVVIMLMSGVGSYKAYESMDTTAFCGQLCHVPMHPELTAFKKSHHSQIRCTDCHVGSNPASYVKAKFAGTHRAYAVIFNKFDRPIPSPLHKLEPVTQTCEECHSPNQFFGTQMKVFSHFGYDDKNTPRQIRMLIYTGGGNPPGPATGIHWHMSISNKITYVSTDGNNQTIPWVRLEDGQGHVTEYTAQDSKLSQQDLDKATKHLMNCMDCHNRVGHKFDSPDHAVDQALLDGELDASLPFIKQQAVQALVKSFPSEADAVNGIASDIEGYYRSNYPDVSSGRQDKVKQAIQTVQNIYRDTVFPSMKADWKTYPDNVGHFYSLGCFRCHDGQHVAKDGT